MKCINCGRELAPGAKFCPACGSQQPAQQPEPVAQFMPEQYTQPEQYDYGYEQQYAAPQKKGKKKGVLIVLIIAAVLAIAGGVLGIVFGVRSCTKYDNSNPRAAAQAIVNALNSNDSRALYEVMLPPSAQSNMRQYASSMPGYAKLLLTDSIEPEDEVFAIADDALRLLHRKVDCIITFDVKNETVQDGKTVLTGDLSFGNINVGELSVAFAQEDGKWYFKDITGQNIDEQKMMSVFGKYFDFIFGSYAHSKSYSSIAPIDHY